MKKNHGSDLSHRLASGDSPRPPHGLLDRIKNDIPDRLTYESGPHGTGGKGREVLLVAAMLLMVVAASLVGVHMMQKGEVRSEPSAMADATNVVTGRRAAVVGKMEAAADAVPTSLAQEEPAAEATDVPLPELFDEGKDAAVGFAPQPAPATASPAPSAVADRSRPARGQSMVASSAPAERVGQLVESEERVIEADDAQTIRAAPAAKASGLAPTREARQTAKSAEREGAAARRREHAVWRDTESTPTVKLDLAIGDGSADRVRRALAVGRLPDPDAIRVEELLNVFDDDRVLRAGDFGVFIEGGPLPGSRDLRLSAMRVVIRAREPRAAVRRILARGATASIEFDPAIVDRYRVVRGDGQEAPGSETPAEPIFLPVTIAEGDRITTLVELRFAPGFDRRKTFATVVFAFRSELDGHEVEIRRPVSFAAFSRNWRTAPPSYRLDILVSTWGRLLASSHPEQNDHSELERMMTAIARERASDEMTMDLRDLVDKTIRILHSP